MAVDAEFDFDSAKANKFFQDLIKNEKSIQNRSTEYVTAISSIVVSNIISHFQDQEGPGGRWAPWGRAYREHMERIGKGGNRLLQDTGFLRQNTRPTNYRKVADGILWYNPAKTKKGFPYAAHHDETANVTRPFMWLNQKAMSNIGEATLRFLLK